MHACRYGTNLIHAPIGVEAGRDEASAVRPAHFLSFLVLLCGSLRLCSFGRSLLALDCKVPFRQRLEGLGSRLIKSALSCRSPKRGQGSPISRSEERCPTTAVFRARSSSVLPASTITTPIQQRHHTHLAILPHHQAASPHPSGSATGPIRQRH